MQNNKISTKVVIGKVGVLTKQEKLKINSPKKIKPRLLVISRKIRNKITWMESATNAVNNDWWKIFSPVKLKNIDIM